MDSEICSFWVPELSPFGAPECAKTIVIHCVFTQNGAPEGALFLSQNEPQHEPKIFQFWIEMEQKSTILPGYN